MRNCLNEKEAWTLLTPPQHTGYRIFSVILSTLVLLGYGHGPYESTIMQPEWGLISVLATKTYEYWSLIKK